MSRLSVIAILACLSAGCHKSSSSRAAPSTVFEQEPNDTSATATAVRLNQLGAGDVDVAGDVDFWSISLGAGQFIQIEIFATRADQAAWNALANVPRLTLYDTDGMSKLLEQDYGGFTSDGWSWGEHDLDLALFRVPAAGTYYVAVTQDDVTLSGADYGIRVAEVTVAAVQNEAEAVGVSGDNDTSGTAEAITPGTVAGFHVDEESDFFSFDVAAPTVVRFTLTAYRNGVYGGDDEYYDPEMALYDTDGATEIYNDDDSYFYDSSIHMRLDTAGTYFVEVLECCGAGDAAYFLEFTSTPIAGATAEVEPNDDTGTAQAIAYGDRVTAAMDAGEVDYFSFTGTAGDMVRLQRFDQQNFLEGADLVDIDLIAPDGLTSLDTGGNSDLQVKTTILQETGTYYVMAMDDGSPVATDYSFELTLYRAAGYETETNDAIAEADAFDANDLAGGVIDPALDTDFFGFTATKNVATTIAVYAYTSDGSDGFFEFSGHGSSLSPLINVYDAGGTLLATSTNEPAASIYTEGVIEGLPTTAVSFLPPASGTYYVEVGDSSGNGGLDYYYVIERR